MSNAYWEKLKQIKKNIYTQLKTNTNLQIDFQRLILVLNAAKVVTFFFLAVWISRFWVRNMIQIACHTFQYKHDQHSTVNHPYQRVIVKV